MIGILYQRYNWQSYSIVRSFVETISRITDCKLSTDPKCDFSDCETIIVFSSILPLPKKRIDQVLVVFGPSDPNMFNKSRVSAANLYITFSLATAREYDETTWMGIYSDIRYFYPTNVMRTHDCVFVGLGSHPHNPARIPVVNALRQKGISVLTFGAGWPKHPDNRGYVVGKDLLNAYCSARVVLDVPTGESSIGSRIPQASLCGTPVITIDREDIRQLFNGESVDQEIILAKPGDYVQTVVRALGRDDLNKIGMAARNRCIRDHDVVRRVAQLFGMIA